jgi:hypothetical protein
MMWRCFGSGLPSEETQVRPAPGIEPYALALEPQALGYISPTPGAQTDLAPGVDDAVPRNKTPLGQGVKSVSHLPSIRPETGEVGHLAVSRHTPGRNAANHGIYALPSARSLG